MTATPVNPVAGDASQIVTGGVPVVAVGAAPNGGFIQNPLSAADQGIGGAESLIINPVGIAGTAANGTNFRLQPGGIWNLIPGQTTQTSVNGATSGHKFSVVVF